MPNANAFPRLLAEPASDNHEPASEHLGGVLPTFASVYERYFRFVWVAARNWGVELGDIDDVVQDVFVAISDRLHTVERPESLRSWIYSVVRRVSSAHRRTAHARFVKSAIVALEDELYVEVRVTPEQLTERAEKVKLLWRLLEQIDPPKREVFVLSELNEMTAPEISSAIGIPLNTVYSRLRLARKELEQILERHRAKSQIARRQIEGEFGRVLT